MAPGVNLVEPGSNGTAESLEPCLVSAAAAEAADATGTWVVLVHAPGENRTGNNYWLVQASRALAAAGIPSVRFDLSGHGESLGPKDAARWLAQADAAVALAAARGATRVLLVARGLYCAQLDTAGAQASGLEVLRVALFPPPGDALAWLAGRGGGEEAPDVEADPAEPAEAAFWTACGAEPNLVGGCVYPRELLHRLIDRLPHAEMRWSHAVTTASWSDRTASVHAVIGEDPLARHATARAAVVDVLVRLATEKGA